MRCPTASRANWSRRGPYTIRGYYNAPDINAQAFTADGFYRMGDIVRKRGRYVYTEGRRKDLINRGGEKISCDEIENLIFRLPQVREVSLVAMPDPVFGEKACACVVLAPGYGADVRRPDRAPAGAADRVVQAAGAARDHGLVPDQPGRQDPEA